MQFYYAGVITRKKDNQGRDDMNQTNQFTERAIEKGIEGWRLVSSQAKQLIELTRKKGSEMFGLKTRQFIERTGIYIFFTSLMLFTQVNWIKKHIHSYAELNIEARLLAGFVIGMLLSLGVIRLIKKIAVKTNKEPEAILNNLSIVLSPGIFFIFASKNKSFLIIGAALCVLIGLYIWVKPFRNFINSILYVDKFKNILLIKDDKAVIDMRGVYEKANPEAMQSFLIDLVINFHECAEMKINEVKINFADLLGKDEGELKPIIESVARYFNIRMLY